MPAESERWNEKQLPRVILYSPTNFFRNYLTRGKKASAWSGHQPCSGFNTKSSSMELIHLYIFSSAIELMKQPLMPG